MAEMEVTAVLAPWTVAMSKGDRHGARTGVGTQSMFSVRGQIEQGC